MNQLNICITQADCLPGNIEFHHRIVLKSLKFKKEPQQITGNRSTQGQQVSVLLFQWHAPDYIGGMFLFKENRIQRSENGELKSLVEQKITQMANSSYVHGCTRIPLSECTHISSQNLWIRTKKMPPCFCSCKIIGLFTKLSCHPLQPPSICGSIVC